MERMEKEDMYMTNMYMTNMYETLHTQVERMSPEIVNLREQNNGSAASTVAASSGSGGCTSNFAAHVMPNPFTATHVELKGWGGLEEHP